MTPNGHFAIAALMLVPVCFMASYGEWAAAPFIAYCVAAAAAQVRFGIQARRR